MALGLMVKRYGAGLIPVVGLFICIFQFIAFLVMKHRLPESAVLSSTEDQKASSLGLFIVENPAFTVLLLGTALLFFAHNAISNFLINIDRNVGGDVETMGFMNAFMAIVELPIMFFYQPLFGKRDPSRLLKTAFIFFTLKILGITLAGSVPALYASMLLQAPSFALYSTAIVPYVDRAIQYKDSAKAQSLAFSVTTVGSVAASMVCGYLFDLQGVRSTLWVACAVCALGTLISITGISLSENNTARRAEKHRP